MIWEKFGKFSSEHSKVSKLGLWWNPFVQRRKCMSLKYTGYLCLMTEEWCKIWRGIDSSVQNWHEKFDEFSPEHSKISKICKDLCLMALDIDAKFQRKLTCAFRSCHEEFGKFSPEHSKFWKLGFSCDPFTQSRKCLRLKFTGELCVMTMKNDAKVEE